MKYTRAHIDIQPLAGWQADLLTQALADIGYDSFEQDEHLLRAYIPSAQLDESSLRHLLEDHGVTLMQLEDCPDDNWNSCWEQEHPVQHLPLGVTITPHCAFGAGHHATTAMLIHALMEADLQGKRVFDHGTGTGVLGIFAKRLGAAYVLADDIDDNSVRNARENAMQNGEEIDVRLAPCTWQTDSFHLIIANIHRNILLEQMADYARALQPGGELWLSGFYEQDVQPLLEEAERHGLDHVSTQADGEWHMLRLRRHAAPAASRRLSALWMPLLLLTACCCLLGGCRQRSHLSKRKMIAVLTDLHRVDGMMQISGIHKHDNEQAAYYDFVLEQHNVTRQEFDSSLVWYTHHPQRFNKLYPQVLKNLEAERSLFVGEAEQTRLMQEQRKRHFDWYTAERVRRITLYGCEVRDYDLCSFRVTPHDSITATIPFRH